MKELPEKWYINVTKENLKILDKWLGKHSYNLGVWSCVHYNKNACDRNNQPANYQEISFEDFQRLVLGINIEKGYELW